MYSELKEVLDYIVNSISSEELVELHKQLSQYYSQAHSTPSVEVTSNIGTTTDSINRAQKNIEPSDWDVIKRRVYNQFGASDYLGNSGQRHLLKNLAQYSNDPHGASQAVNEFANEIEKLKARAQQSIQSLEGLLTVDESEKGRRIQIVFDNKVAINTFETMEGQAREWNQLLKIMRQVSNTSDGEAQIHKVNKFNPLVIVS
jgi:hypothetical protein